MEPSTEDQFQSGRTCPKCSLSDSVLLNAQLGHIVCTNCGYIIQENLIRDEVFFIYSLIL